MAAQLVRYRSPDEDSSRWWDFEFREGDIVISTRSKSGTTWLQMICALLVFGAPDFQEPLWKLSPWLDWLGAPRADVYERLAAQSHRRIIKTHTPLDGVPIDVRATYIVVGRQPLDMAVSLYHQGDNLDRERIGELIGQPIPQSEAARPSLHDWLVSWIEWDGDFREQLDSLPGIMWHLSDAWERQVDGNIVLVHYQDLYSDLETEMRRLAATLGIEVPEASWSDLFDAARFDQMKARAGFLAPDGLGVFKSTGDFFRRGSPGAANEVLSSDELDTYFSRAKALASAELLDWLHRET